MCINKRGTIEAIWHKTSCHIVIDRKVHKSLTLTYPVAAKRLRQGYRSLKRALKEDKRQLCSIRSTVMCGYYYPDSLSVTFNKASSGIFCNCCWANSSCS